MTSNGPFQPKAFYDSMILCATRLTLLQTVVEPRLHFMNKNVLKCILKYSLFSAKLHMKSACDVYYFLHDIGQHEEELRFFLLVTAV